EADEWLELEGIEPENRRTERFAGLRYMNQGSEIVVPWPRDGTDEATIEALIRSFHQGHEQTYAFSHPDIAVQLVTLHVRASGVVAAPEMPQLPPARPLQESLRSMTTVHFREGSVACPIYA